MIDEEITKKILGNNRERRADIILKIAAANELQSEIEISKSLNIDRTNLTKHLKVPLEYGIIILDEKEGKKRGKLIAYRMNESIETLAVLFKIFNDNQIQKLMSTEYYHKIIPGLMSMFEEACIHMGLKLNEKEKKWLDNCFQNSISFSEAVLNKNISELIEMQSQLKSVVDSFELQEDALETWEKIISGEHKIDPNPFFKVHVIGEIYNLLSCDKVYQRYCERQLLDFDNSIRQ
ncbi:Uncharacterised protein [uncultured archaeon]|nr:Uncharacterised protein [uncultured archaeon]